MSKTGVLPTKRVKGGKLTIIERNYLSVTSYLVTRNFELVTVDSVKCKSLSLYPNGTWCEYVL